MRLQARGFTLIELLVVISIIAMLISILLPALGRAKTAAQDLNCQANQRQVGVAFQVYTGDNDGSYPQWEDSATFPKVYWPARMLQQDLLPGGEVFECPRFADAANGFSFSELNLERYALTDWRFNRVHYGFNAYNLGCSYRQLTADGSSLSTQEKLHSAPARAYEITRPSETVMLADSINVASRTTDPPGFGSYALADYYPGTLYAAALQDHPYVP